MEDRSKDGVVVSGLTLTMKTDTYVDIEVNGELVRIFFVNRQKIVIQGDRKNVVIGHRKTITRAA